MVFQAVPVQPAQRPPGEASPVSMVELTLYADDCLVFGRLALTADRVTDLMNDRPEFEFVDACLESLDDGHELLVNSVYVSRDEIVAVGVAGPRGDPRRRTPTGPVPVELRVGRYTVLGNLHGAGDRPDHRLRRPRSHGPPHERGDRVRLLGWTEALSPRDHPREPPAH